MLRTCVSHRRAQPWVTGIGTSKAGKGLQSRSGLDHYKRKHPCVCRLIFHVFQAVSTDAGRRCDKARWWEQRVQASQAGGTERTSPSAGGARGDGVPGRALALRRRSSPSIPDTLGGGCRCCPQTCPQSDFSPWGDLPAPGCWACWACWAVEGGGPHLLPVICCSQLPLRRGALSCATHGGFWEPWVPAP